MTIPWRETRITWVSRTIVAAPRVAQPGNDRDVRVPRCCWYAVRRPQHRLGKWSILRKAAATIVSRARGCQPRRRIRSSWLSARCKYRQIARRLFASPLRFFHFHHDSLQACAELGRRGQTPSSEDRSCHRRTGPAIGGQSLSVTDRSCNKTHPCEWMTGIRSQTRQNSLISAAVPIDTRT